MFHQLLFQTFPEIDLRSAQFSQSGKSYDWFDYYVDILFLTPSTPDLHMCSTRISEVKKIVGFSQGLGVTIGYIHKQVSLLLLSPFLSQYTCSGSLQTCRKSEEKKVLDFHRSWKSRLVIFTSKYLFCYSANSSSVDVFW